MTFSVTLEFHSYCHSRGGGRVAQSVERGTPGEEVLGLIPAVAARLGWCQYNVSA